MRYLTSLLMKCLASIGVLMLTDVMVQCMCRRVPTLAMRMGQSITQVPYIEPG